MTMTLDGTAGMTAPQGAVYNGLATANAQASTSGTAIDFTNIPIWVKRITVFFVNVSTNGTSPVQIQIGSGTFTTTGYAGTASTLSTGVTTGAMVSGFLISQDSAANVAASGFATLANVTGNTWVMSCSMGRNQYSSASTTVGGGYLALSGVLDRVRITTVSGTDTFDAGTINIMYE